jgi:hypothetical protein
MSTPPPLPFGDPSKIQQENSAAVRKGVAFGCGGCALLAAAVAVFGACIFWFIMSMIRGADASQMSLQAAQSSEVMRRELGEPIALGWLVTGSISITNGNGRADITVPVSGPKGAASIHTVGSKKAGSPWTFSTMKATIEADGQTVDLRAP